MSRVEIQESLIEVMDTDLSDAVVSVVFESNASFYNTATGNVTAGDTESGRGISYGYSESEIDNEQIHQTDRQLIIVQSEFNQIPALDWFCTIGSDRYQIVSVIRDPFESIAEYQLRLM